MMAIDGTWLSSEAPCSTRRFNFKFEDPPPSQTTDRSQSGSNREMGVGLTTPLQKGGCIALTRRTAKAPADRWYSPGAPKGICSLVFRVSMGYVASVAVACQRPPRRYGLSSLPRNPAPGDLAATAAQSAPIDHRSNLHTRRVEGWSQTGFQSESQVPHRVRCLHERRRT